MLQCGTPPQIRKLFIGGLSQETTSVQLREYFSRWGPVVDAIVMRDMSTKQSRGFGFVTFGSVFSAELAMMTRPHVIGGRKVDSKRAIPRDQMVPPQPVPFLSVQVAAEPGCSVLLSGIIERIHSIDALRIYFDTFGTLDQIQLRVQPPGPAVVIFAEKASADRCLAHNSGCHVVNGQRIQVTEAPDD
ncbi:unnamed protein product [Caenorhabditis sp. 36 PRJEB53466]|nr:unnamed protein product [Caenorhabditis sp. 36 PRJEB53466]